MNESSPTDPYVGIRNAVGPVFLDQASQIVAGYRQHAEDTRTAEVICLQNAQVALFEDDPDYASTVGDFLDIGGHVLAFHATNIDEALCAIPKLGQMGITIALVDGNLGRWSRGGADGRQIIEEIRKKYGKKIKIIGLSSDPLPDADVDWTKNGGLRGLIDLISSS
jgi:CheY-like chemotaxis protein